MVFLYEHGKNGIRILRVFGSTEEVEIPEDIDGESVTELGDYIFSDRIDKKLLEEYKKRGSIYKSGISENEEQKEVAGTALREVRLPKGLRRIGRYAFYTCANLQKLTFHGVLLDIGAGAFTGCHKVNCLRVELENSGVSCLRELLLELPEEKMVEYQKNGEEGRFWFPEFFEEGVEDTPARNTEVRVHGSGMYYRNCFHSREFSVREYDEQFYFACTEEKENLVVQLAMGRLLYPMELSDKAKATYQAYLKEHFTKMAEILLKKKEHRSFGILLKTLTPSIEQVEEVLNMASKVHNTEVVSLLMDYRHEKVRPNRRVFEL